MASTETTPPAPSRPWLSQTLLYLLLVLVIFTFPNQPTLGLDASWRMALGKFLLDGLQFGRDVVFTYGPLGFLMGKTYYGSGVLFRSLLLWQVFAALTFGWLIMRWGDRLEGKPRFFYYAFFVLFGVTYDDALQMLVIALAGYELLRQCGQPKRWSSVFLLLLLAFLGTIKFTNLMLATFLVLVIAAHEIWRRRGGDAARVVAWFAGGYLAMWLACWQNPLNLPAYFKNSWVVSQGYQEVMGIATPSDAFWTAMFVHALVGIYLLCYLFTQKDRARALAYSTAMAGLIFMNWKHGFVRSDGHMIGYFYCALLPVVAFPALLEDSGAWPRLKRWLLVPAGVLCILGIRDALPGMVDGALGLAQAKIWGNVYNLAHVPDIRDGYNDHLAHARIGAEMPRTRAIVGTHSLDVIGYDQAEALFNRFNYTPRPVLQSYSVYTPELARLNADFYLSDRAPDFVLMRMNSIDQRLPVMDDSATLYIISHRYTYVLSEKSFQLWQKKPGPFDYTQLAPQPLASRELPLCMDWPIEEFADKYLWVNVDLSYSLLGRLRNFLYKPPFVYVAVKDTSGNSSTYRMPTPIGRAGFILSPLVEDLMGFLHFAGGRPERRVRSIQVWVAAEDQKYFAATVRLQLSTLTPSLGAKKFFEQVNSERFHMFNVAPVAYEAQAIPSEEVIDGQQVMVMHAPSEMTFDLPAHASEINGKHGFLPGAYSNGGNTNGAEFLIVWSNGKDTIELYRRFMDPVKESLDRGLKNFHIDLKHLSGGRVYFRVLPGPYNDHSWDWTAWTGIEIQ